MCASFEVLCYTWLKRFLYSLASLVVLGPEELSARNFKKNVSPLSRTWFIGVPIS